MTPAQWKKVHEQRGCYGCRYACEELLGHRACCEFWGPLATDEKGRCRARKEKKP